MYTSRTHQRGPRKLSNSHKWPKPLPELPSPPKDKRCWRGAFYGRLSEKNHSKQGQGGNATSPLTRISRGLESSFSRYKKGDTPTNGDFFLTKHTLFSELLLYLLFL